MKWRLRWARPAEKDLRRLDPSVKKRIVEAMRTFAETGKGDVAKLTDLEGYRLRVGDWRVFFEPDRDTETIHVTAVQPRGRAYR